MPALTKRRSNKPREVLKSGPFKGVKSTTDPFDDTPDYLVDAVNMYIPDAASGSGIYARPGFALMNPSNQLGGANHMGQAVYHETFSGVDYNFEVVSGVLYRSSADSSAFVDVTPAGITIDSSTSTRVFLQEFAGYLVVSDGVNRPWVGSNLANTPITGAPIQYDAANSQWAAQHMTLYSGAIVFKVKSVAGVLTPARITWSAPFDPTQGYANTVLGIAVDYVWDVVQTGSTPIYAIYGTNIALLYWRDYSIGGLSGALGPDFQGSATHDAIDFKIGTRSPATLASVGNTIFFCDSDGRPQMLPLGDRIVPIWLQARNLVEMSRTDTPATTQLTAIGVIYPSLNLYVVAIWSALPSINLSPNQALVFDALTGQYVGRWVIGDGINIETMGILKDQNGQPELVVIGTKVQAINLGFGGYVWRLTNPHEAIWTDNGAVPLIQAQTARIGFDADVIRYADSATAITGSTSPCSIVAVSAAQLEQSFVVDFLMTEGQDFLMTESGSAQTTLFARSTTATYVDVNGIVQTAAINVARTQNYVAGVGPAVLYEPTAATNLAIRSQEFDNAAYTNVGTPVVTANSTTAPDGTLTADTISDPDAGTIDGRRQTITVPANTNSYCMSVYILKTVGTPDHFPIINARLTGGVTVDFNAALNTTTGATTTVGTGTTGVIDTGLYWRFYASITNGGANTSFLASCYPAGNTTLNANLAAAGVGANVFWGLTVEVGTVPSSYIPTTTVAVTRAADIESAFLAATANGYTRTTGSFVTDGFTTGMQLTPSGFTSNPVDTVSAVSALSITTGARSVEASAIGRSLHGVVLGDFIMTEGIQQAISTPYPSSLDGTYRCTWGLDIEGRGVNLTISPTTALSQWKLYQVQMTSVASRAPTEEA